ncbi:MAG: hypothetical protein NWE92_03070 [Candidatus Bathyarchaeota archaeon]|nr:hypothetical protein [Candidatus Bathyarchaeota archaeon]
MRKLFKIILAIIAAIVIIFAAFAAVILLDLAAYTATGAQTLTPTGASIGNAIVMYDPGLSADTKTVADQIAAKLQNEGYTVILAGIKSAAAANTTGYDIIVVGGPVYAGALSASVKDELGAMSISQGAAVGVFGSGQGTTSTEDVAMLEQSLPARQDNALQDAVVVKIGNTEDIEARAQSLVDQLI